MTSAVVLSAAAVKPIAMRWELRKGACLSERVWTLQCHYTRRDASVNYDVLKMKYNDKYNQTTAAPVIQTLSVDAP
jgi:hypothetical protein